MDRTGIIKSMVSSREITQRGKNTVDPRFPIPLGLVDLAYEQDNRAPFDSFQADAPETPIDSGVGVVVPNIQGNKQSGLAQAVAYQPPTNVSVLSQTVKILPDGSYIVDVLLDVTDVPGITEYDVRVSKL